MDTLYLKETQKETILKLNGINLKNVYGYTIQKTSENKILDLTLKIKVRADEVIIDTKKVNLK